MLLSLSVQNFAIIDNIQINFNPGMTVLTGETGAGKSLIIDAIGLLFGQRASSEMIRHGETKATIEGVFSQISPKMQQILHNLGIDTIEDDMLSIKRELYASGKSICRICNQTITLNQLAEISESIGDIHSQIDTLGLINPKNYIQFITNQEILELLSIYETHLKAYKSYEKQYQTILKQHEASKEKEEFLRYQTNEFIQANLSIEEELALKNEATYLENYEKIAENIKELNQIYQNDSTMDAIYHSIQILDKLKQYDEKFAEAKTTIEEAYYTLVEATNDVLVKNKQTDFDYRRLEEINERLSVYAEFRRKYKKTTTEIIAYIDQIKQELEFIENYEFNLETAKKQKQESYQRTLAIAYTIREKRQFVAQTLQASIKKHLLDLQLKNVRFDIIFREIDEAHPVFKQDGIDDIDFYVSFNQGEPTKPLSKVASGGEMSRFMLALKTVLGDKLPLQTKIFDEIDHGVSGAIAYSIAEKIKSIATKSQVLCITHLPQVAAIADHHLKIKKLIEDNRTITHINRLTEQERIREIARMISKGEPTPASIQMATELRS